MVIVSLPEAVVALACARFRAGAAAIAGTAADGAASAMRAACRSMFCALVLAMLRRVAFAGTSMYQRSSVPPAGKAVLTVTPELNAKPSVATVNGRLGSSIGRPSRKACTRSW